MKTVFVQTDRCIGCRQCEIACAVEHSASKDAARAVFERPLPKPRIHVESGGHFNTSFPGRCRHCDPAPCIGACPTAAMHRDPDLGFVLVDGGKCIACAMCAMVCPFDAVTFHPSATKCDGCVERVREGRVPACVEACKTGALGFGDLNEIVRAGRARSAVRAFATAEAANRDGGSRRPDGLTAWRSWGERASELARR